jgi:S-layer protein (TIGR01567 family)
MFYRALWLCIVLLIGSAVAADVPFVFDGNAFGVAGYSQDQIEQASASSSDLNDVPFVSSLSDNETLEFPITGGGSAPGSVTEKKVGELKATLDARVEPGESRVREEATVLALKYPGDLTIDQIASIYSYLKNGDGTKKGWGYVRDPRGIDDFGFANKTLKIGDRANCVGGGDCDDFAILMSALIESIGGTTRIILARNNTEGGHAYAEVYLGNLKEPNDQVEGIINWLKQKFNTDKIYTHIDTETKDVWLNLDWGADEMGNMHPGGPFFSGDKHIVINIRDKYAKTPLNGSSSAMGPAKVADFAFSDWGRYYIIEYFDGIYFAGYANGYLKDNSGFGILRSNQRSKVLIDNRKEQTVTSFEPLVLAQGYQLIIRSIDIDGNKVYLELSKDGQVVDSKVIAPSWVAAIMSDKTYYYKKNLGDTQDIVIIAVHFKNAFRGADQNLATIDGVFQISELIITDSTSNNHESPDLEEIDASSAPESISDLDKIPPRVLAFKARSLNLTSGEPVIFDYAVSDDGGSRINHVELWRSNGYNWQIITTNTSDIYPYRVSGSFIDTPSIPGKYRYGLHVVDNANNWNDDDDKIFANNELSATNKGLLQPLPGQDVINLSISEWGSYYGFKRPDEIEFAGYADGYLKDLSDYGTLRRNQISRVLIDDRKEQTVTISDVLVLAQGYQLSIKSIDIDGNKVYLELSKDGQVVDSKVIAPSKDAPTVADKTYYYKMSPGRYRNNVIIAVHFKNAFRGVDQNTATVDGVFQISDEILNIDNPLNDYGSIEVQIV